MRVVSRKFFRPPAGVDNKARFSTSNRAAMSHIIVVVEDDARRSSLPASNLREPGFDVPALRYLTCVDGHRDVARNLSRTLILGLKAYP